MDKPKINTATVYGAVARLMPLEGRDFKIDAGYDEQGNVKLILDPITAIGRAWIPFLQQELETSMANDGVTVKTGGIAEQEIVTVRTIRARVEEEARTALRAKIAAAEADQKKKLAAADAVRHAQVEKEGEDSNPSDAVRRAYAEANSAGAEVYRLQRVEKKVEFVRVDIDKASHTAAKEDEKAGRFWAVDMDAPLTSLFDRQDVYGKFKAKEDAIFDLANRAVAMDDVRNNAINIAKQYIVQKEG